MKVYEIALFLFMFNLAIGFVNYALNDYGLPSYGVMQDYSYIETALEQTNTTGFSISRFVSSVPIVGDIYNALRITVSVVWNSIIGFPNMMEQYFGMPGYYAKLIRALLLFVYAAGIADFLRGTGGVET